ncbi:MAG: 2-oxoacid:acceptor oxidoreductase family protein [Aminobacterium sp.]|jgi:2-oxoglutarate ferredoxin oxidoreductase subunit gamma|uniref:2-oxoacid:acceptor oxidoreductase family protein n=1 Tax=unclassified Aminobacterium TaxID=2685012 RepID=UPI001BCE97D9|nr:MULTISPECIES: 2-oxoacid:acceptor oxidoreductase family protein [unclassified Aminobacterium]MDD2205865.1 2-oxoacid:acceptor oxidoreductase family protein [Aminobacterium sp.]MDD3427101.1 2-oxoacid:acceptor oxidoreductase family protein [Aminobacterium sp.]MDD3706686.1 2-oxoacid:acceptor oxidoreductase family protein [Aminobacterium sp.]MDD4228120.1 2-oxoacid:acceptor oxidoreductase family protein [Aminobacterium sp.]MDD4550865.1 2-oxoacid:acceptor oxidoreductase family protein [Aminobacteri
MTEKMNKSLIAAGFGGQGVMVLGQLVAYTGIAQGLHVTWIPSYGPEMRGGTANCGVVLSSEEIASPVVAEADAAVIMNQPSLTKFENSVKKGGVLIYNSDLVTYENPRTDIHVIAVPANSLAVELGSDKVANIVALGTLVEATGIVESDTCIETIKEKLGKRKPKFLPMNLEAFEKGKELARKVLEK